MAKKLLSVILALSMVLTILAACNQNDPVTDPVLGDEQEAEGHGGEVSEIIDLVVDGVSEYVIVRGENAYISEITAATELQSYLKQISGFEIPIVTDSAEPVAKEIVVGKTNRETDGEFDREELCDDGFVIKTSGQKLFLVGGEQRGTLYSVYEFLESYLGCGFYTNDIEKVPETQNITLVKIEEDKQIPIMNSRDISWGAYSGFEDICVKRKINGQQCSISDTKGGRFIWNPYVHTFASLVNYGTYGAEHPEYFAHTEDGTVISNEGRPQLCLTNPDVLQIVIDTVKSWIQSTPGVKVVSVSQNDGGGPCMCSNCQAVYAEENGAYSGTNIRFVNAVAAAIKEEYPDVMIDTLAYQYSREACVTKPAENVIVRLCTIECCFTHALSECDVKTFDPHDSEVSPNSFAEDLKAWGQICNNVYIWDYTTNFWLFTVNFSSFDVLRENMKFFAENNVKGVFEQGNGFTSCGEFDALRSYLISKLLWNPYMSEEEYSAHMNDFLANVYGPGWAYIREYIDLREAYNSNYHAGCKQRADDVYDIYNIKQVTVREKSEIPEGITLDMYDNYQTADWSPYLNFYYDVPKPELVEKGYELFEKALEMAETEKQKTELDKALIQVEILDSHYRLKAKAAHSLSISMVLRNVLPTLEMPEDKLAEYKACISTYLKYFIAKFDDEYYQFNKTLGEKMIGYGITTVKECWDADAYFYPGEANYSKDPRSW